MLAEDHGDTPKRNQNFYNNTVVTSSDQLLQQSYEGMNKVPQRFYRQVTYDDQLQAYAFTNTNALVLAESSTYVIFHEPTNRNFRYNPDIRQFRQIRTVIRMCAFIR